MTREGDGLALDHLHANLIGEQAHDRGALDPGNGFKLLAPLVDGYEEDVAADVFTEDGEQLGARDLGESGSLDVACAGDAEAGVAFKIGSGEDDYGAKASDHDECAKPKKDAARSAGRAPPAATLFSETLARGIVVVRVLHFEGHAGQSSPGSGRGLLNSPETRLRGRFFLPDERPRCGIPLIFHTRARADR